MENQEKQKTKIHIEEQTNNIGKFNFSEFVVDFLGALVPGLIFLFILVTLISGPLGVLVILTKQLIVTIANINQEIDTLFLIKKMLEFSNDFWIQIGIFTLIASYVIGHCFFRKDPKIPDKASFLRISKNPKFEKDSWVVKYEENGEINIEYPYLYLFEYLKERELNHLLKIVPWRGEKKDSHKKRTKFFINLLKIRLQFFFPNKCGTIRRNEGHVRLMSSIWFISKTLIYTGLISLGIILIAGIVFSILKSTFLIFTIIPFIISIVITLFAVWSKFTIEKYLHYMRVREILYVLETACTAHEVNPKILEGVI